jgi:hypothetical protein
VRFEELRARWSLRRCIGLDEATGDNVRVWTTGVVRPLDETLVAPLSGRVCVAYRSRVWGWSGPQIVHETMQLRPFILDLGDEEIVVDGVHAIFGITPIKLDRDAVREASFLARHASSTRAYARFAEVALELGVRVTVGGTLVLVPRDEPPIDELGFRDPPPPSQRIVGNRDRPLVLV